MPQFCINTNSQDNGDNEVHNLTEPCNNMPLGKNQVDLGFHNDCQGAVKLAKAKGWTTANGCAHCSPDCHTG